MGRCVLQIFVGDAFQIGWRLQQPLIERAQHANWLFTARVKGFDLFPRQRCLGALGQLDKSLFANRAKEVEVQLHLWDGVSKGVQLRGSCSRRRIHAARVVIFHHPCAQMDSL